MLEYARLMTPTPKVHYDHEEVCLRFKAWADIPVISDKHITMRNDAWNTYCDARDSLPAGTSHARQVYGRIHSGEEPRQLRMFS